MVLAIGAVVVLMAVAAVFIVRTVRRNARRDRRVIAFAQRAGWSVVPVYGQNPPWLAATAGGVPVVLLKIAGVAEVLGAFGLILPAVTRILPILTPLAAVGLAVTMLGATIANLVIGMFGMAFITLVLGLLAGFVAWARLTRRTDRRVEPSTVPDAA